MRSPVPNWGASWLLPDQFTIAWGGRAIADKNYSIDKFNPDNPKPTHVASFLSDRQHATGNMDKWPELKQWLESKILPIRLNYWGSDTKITRVDDRHFHCCYTPNGSHGYLYVVAWID